MASIDEVPAPKPEWIAPLARMGYGARGLVYVIIAVFALLAAIGGGEKEDTRGAIAALMATPFGDVLIMLVVAGFAGYFAWRMVQALWDADDHGKSAKGLAVRGALLVSGGIYAVLAFYALSLWLGSRGPGASGGGFAEALTGFVGARAIALALAAIVAGVGLAHLWRAAGRKFDKYLAPPDETKSLVTAISICGLAARGLVFLIIAMLFATRGIHGGDGKKAPGLRDALDFLQGLPAGNWLLGAMALGLAAFAAYSFCEALWRRIDV